MFKQSPSRIQRSKGFKIKHGLQIFLLIAICFWLLYQVKHSHDKKKAFDESLMKLSSQLDGEHKTADIGRKGLRTQVDEKASGDDISEKEEVIGGDEEDTKPEEEEDEEKNKLEEEEEGEKARKPEEEEDQSKHGEDEEVNKDDQEEETEEEEENKSEENEEEGEGVGDDLIDEQDQQGDEEEAENDVLHEEEKGVDEETEEGRGREQLAKMENADSSEDQDHDRNTQEAREENYKRDDASSAVFRETRLETTESDRVHLDVDEKEQADSIINKKLEMEKIKATMSDGNNKLEKPMLGGNVEGNSSVMVKTDEEKGIKSSQISTASSNPDKIPEVGNSSKVEQTRTGMDSGLSQEQKHDMMTSDQSGSNVDTFNQTENSNVTSGTAKLDLNSKVSNVTENADVVEAKGSDTSNNGTTLGQGGQTGTADSQNNTSPSAANELNNGTQSGETKSTDSQEKADDSKASLTSKGDTDVIQSATTTSKSNIILEEEKEAHIDLGTLPETETKGSKNKEDAAL